MDPRIDSGIVLSLSHQLTSLHLEPELLQETFTQPSTPSTPCAIVQQRVETFLAKSGAWPQIEIIKSFFCQKSYKIQNIELAGSELFKVFGIEFFREDLRKVDDTTSAHFWYELQKPITSCTVRFNLFEPPIALYTLVTQLKERHFPSASKPFQVNAQSILAGFTIEGPIRFHYVFATKLHPRFFATVDAIQVDITSANVSIIDNGYQAQWLSDTLSRRITIPDPEQRHEAKQFFMYLAQGYRPTEEAYALFIREYFQEGKPLKILLEKLVRDFTGCEEATYYFTLLICSVLEHLGKSDISKSFLEETSTSHSTTNSFWGCVWNLFKQEHLNFPQSMAFLYTMGAMLTHMPHSPRLSVSYSPNCSSGVMTFRVCIKNLESHFILPFEPDSVATHFASIPSSFFLSKTFLDFCSFYTSLFPEAEMHPRTNSRANSSNFDESLKDFLAKCTPIALGSRSTLPQILKETPHVIFTCPSSLQGLLFYIVQQVLNIPFVPNGANDQEAFFEEWLDTLLAHPDQQIVTCARTILIELAGRNAYKKKHLANMIRQDQAVAARLMSQLKPDIAADDLGGWLMLSSHPGLLLEPLMPDCFSLCVASFTPLMQKSPAQARLVLQTLTCDSMLEHWALYFQHQDKSRLHSTLYKALCTLINEKITKLPLSKWPQNAFPCLQACYPDIDQKVLLVDDAIAYLMPNFFCKVIDDLVAKETLSSQDKTTLRKVFEERVSALHQIRPRLVLCYFMLCCKHIPDKISTRYRIFLIETFLSLLEKKELVVSDIHWWYALGETIKPQATKPVDEVRILIQVCRQFPQVICPIHEAHLKRLCRHLQDEQKRTLMPDIEQVEQTYPQFLPLFTECRPIKQLPIDTASAKPAAKTRKSPPKGIDETIKNLVRQKPAKWQQELVTMLAPTCLSTTWEIAFNACNDALEFNTISAMILKFHTIRDQVSDELAQKVFAIIFLNLNWLRAEHIVLFKETAYFRQLFSSKLANPQVQEVCLFFVKKFLALLESGKHAEYMPAAYDWWVALDASCPEKKPLGYRLFGLCLLVSNEASFRRCCELVFALHDYLKTLSTQTPASNEKRKNKKQTLHVVENLQRFVKMAKTFSSHPKAPDALLQVMFVLFTYKESALDDFLLTWLFDFPDIRVAEALVEIYNRLSIRYLFSSIVVPDAINRAYEGLLLRLLEKASLKTALDLYASYFLTAERNPSTAYLFTFKELPRPTTPLLQAHFTKISAFYPQRLRDCVAQGTASDAKKALEIALSLCFSPSTHALQIFTQNMPDHFDVMAGLFIRVLEEFGWSEEVKKLVNHLLVLVTKSKISDQTNMAEFYEHIILPSCCEHFYLFLLSAQQPLPVEDAYVVVPRSTIIKEGKTPLPSEEAFLVYVRSLIEKALLRGANKSLADLARARLLDFAAQNIRTLLELYPNASGINDLLKNLCACVDIHDSDALQKAHLKITLTLKKQAALVPKTQNLETLAHIKKRILDFKEHLDTCSRQNVLDLQHEIFSWQDNEFVDAYSLLYECIEQLLELIKKKELFADSKIHEMMELLFIPHMRCFGSNDGEAGKKYAVTSCLRYTITLTESHTLQAVNFLKNAQKGYAFADHYESFCNLVISIIPHFLNKAKFRQSFVLFTALVCSPVITRAELVLKNKLIAFWMQHSQHTDDSRRVALLELLEMQAPTHFLDEDIELANYIYYLICTIRQEPLRTDIFNCYKRQVTRFRFPDLPPIQARGQIARKK